MTTEEIANLKVALGVIEQRHPLPWDLATGCSHVIDAMGRFLFFSSAFVGRDREADLMDFLIGAPVRLRQLLEHVDRQDEQIKALEDDLARFANDSDVLRLGQELERGRCVRELKRLSKTPSDDLDVAADYLDCDPTHDYLPMDRLREQHERLREATKSLLGLCRRLGSPEADSSAFDERFDRATARVRDALKDGG